MRPFTGRLHRTCQSAQCSGTGPTEFRIVLGVGALVETTAHNVSVAGFTRLFDVGAVVAVVGMAVVFVLAAVRHARALYLAEPIPGRAH